MGPFAYRSFAYRSWVEISLKQIVENFRAVRDVVGPGRGSDAGGEGGRLPARGRGGFPRAGCRRGALAGGEQRGGRRHPARPGNHDAHFSDGGFPARRTSRPSRLQPDAGDSFARRHCGMGSRGERSRRHRRLSSENRQRHGTPGNARRRRRRFWRRSARPSTSGWKA